MAFPKLKLPTAASLAIANRTLNRARSRSVALSIQGMSLHYLMTEKRRILDWGQVPFNPAFLRSGCVADQQGMAQLIRNLLSKKGYTAMPVIAVFPGFQSIVRILSLPKAGDVKPATVLPREARRLMAYAENEQYLFWNKVVGGEGNSYAVIAVPRVPLQNFLGMLKTAGIAPARVELAPLCLVRSLGQGNAIVANVEADSIDICIVVNSLPALVRSLWLGDELLSADTAADRVAEELQNTISFYNDANPANPLSPSLAVHLAGVFPVDELSPIVARETGHPVLPLLPPVTAPEGFSPAAMAIPAGLLLS